MFDRDGKHFFTLANRTGPMPRPGEQVGMALYIGIPGKGAISLFEPWNIFDSALEK